MTKIKLPSLEKNKLSTFLTYTALACAINIVVFLVINAINMVHFEMSDDFFYQNMLSGSQGAQYTYFLTVNTGISHMLAGLYAAIPAVNWYGVFLFGCLLGSSSLIGGILMDKFDFKLGLGLYLVSLSLLFALMLNKFTFTLISYAVMTCAFACLVYGFFSANKKTRTLLYVLSGVSLVTAVLLRRETIASALVYGGIIVLLLLIHYRKKAVSLLLTVLISAGIIGCFYAADTLYYQSDPALESYKEYSVIRSNLVDRQPLNYMEDLNIYETVGWSQADTIYVSNHTFFDDPKFSTENMEYVRDELDYKAYNKDFPSIMRELANRFHSSSAYLLICLFVVFLIAFLSQKRKLFKFYTVLLVALPFLFQILFAIMWRTIFRTVYPHYMMSILLLMVWIDKDGLKEWLQKDGKISPRMVWAAFLCLVLTASVGLGDILLLTKWDAEEKEADNKYQIVRSAFDVMYNTPDVVYLYTSQTPLLNAHYYYSIFETFPEDYFINSRFMGGWDSRTPSYNDFKERYGLEMLPDSAIDNENVVVLMPDAGYLETYFNEKYGYDMKFEELTPMGPFSAKYVVTPTEEEIAAQKEAEAEAASE